MNFRNYSLLVCLFFSVVSSFSQCNWENLGPSDTNTIANQGTAYSDLAINSNNHSYLVFSDAAESGKITARKFDGTSWTTVGAAGFSLGQAIYNSIAIDNNNIPFVAYCDLGDGGSVIVKKFDGTDWVQVGSNLSVNSSTYTSIAINNSNIPYVAYKDGDNGDKVTVKMFDGTNWIVVGTAGFSTGTATYISLAISTTNVPFVVYQDGGYGNKATVKKFDGTNWLAVGVEGFTVGATTYTKIAINSLEVPYVIYADGSNDDKITTMSYDGTNWIPTGIPATKGRYCSISIDENDVIHRIYNDYSTSNVSVARFNSGANTWSTVGNPSFSLGWMQHSIKIANDGTVYIAFLNSSEMIVWKCINNKWQIVGVPGFSSGTSSIPTSMVVSRDGIPYVAYAEFTNLGRIFVKKYDNNAWEQVGGSLGNLTGGSESFSLAMDTSDVLHIIIGRAGGSVEVSKFDGTSWVSLPYVNDGLNITAKGYYCDMAFDRDNVPYLSYRDDNSSSTLYTRAIVRKFNTTTEYWNLPANQSPSVGAVRGTSIVVDSENIPYVAFTDLSTGHKVTVRRKISGNINWINVGPSYTITTGEAFFVDMAISKNDTLYIVYQDFSAGKKATVKKFDGTNWVTVGPLGFTPGEAYNTVIAIDSAGTPYVSFGDMANGGKISVMKFDGSNWVAVGSLGFSANQVADIAGRPSTAIGIAPSGTIYTAYNNFGYTAAKKFNTSASYHYETICSENIPFVWNGESYSSSGTYQYTVTNTVGCDSTATLFLTVNPPIVGIDNQTACESYTWIDNNTYTSSNNTATHTFVGGAANGCDSTVTLNLIINQPSIGIDTQIACDSFVWIDGITYTASNNTATFVLINSNNCDSIVTLNLTLFYTTSSIYSHTACGSFIWNGTTYTSSNNTATITLANSNGCDSIVTLDLTILPHVTGTDVQMACGPFTWLNGNTYSYSNNTAVYTFVGGAANGCDSSVTLNLTVTNIYSNVVNDGASIAPTEIFGDLYEWYDCNTDQLVFTGRAFYPTVNGNYKVVITKGDCTDTSLCYAYNNVGIEITDADKIMLYPNPTQNLLYIDGVMAEFIQVFSLNGQEVIAVSNQNSVDVSSLVSGCYVIEINRQIKKLFLKE